MNESKQSEAIPAASKSAPADRLNVDYDALIREHCGDHMPAKDLVRAAMGAAVRSALAANAVTVPEGWLIRDRSDLEPGAIDVEGPGFDRLSLTSNHGNSGWRMLFGLARALLVAKAGEARSANNALLDEAAERAQFEHAERASDLVRDEDEPDEYRNTHVQSAWDGWKKRAALTRAPATTVAAKLEPVHGDLLPPIDSEVLIHLASQDEWVKHTVVGYYVWGDLNGDSSLQRVNVRVRSSAGQLNARMLRDVRRLDGTPLAVDKPELRARCYATSQHEASKGPRKASPSDADLRAAFSRANDEFGHKHHWNATSPGVIAFGRAVEHATIAALANTASRQPWTQADANAWGERHDLKIHGADLFCAFEDAATLHLTRGQP